MPRLEQLQNLHSNRTYAVNATVKYLHKGSNSVTGILQQDNAQSKFCIRNNDVTMNQGYNYAFDKCFNSNNGWLYVRDPKNSVHQGDLAIGKEPAQLKQIFQNRNSFVNKYVSVALFVAELHTRKTFVKHQQSLTLDTLTCFGNGALIDVNIWNQNIGDSIEGKWILLDGFRLKFNGPDSMSLSSSVYSKIQLILPPAETQQFDRQKTYKNLSNLYQSRNINEVQALSQLNSKIYSHIKTNITDMKQFQYQGCSNCKRKLNQGKCIQCGEEIMTMNYKYIGVQLNDGQSLMYASIFDSEIIKSLLECNFEKILSVQVWVKSKTDLSAEVARPSHVLTKLNVFSS